MKSPYALSNLQLMKNKRAPKFFYQIHVKTKLGDS